MSFNCEADFEAAVIKMLSEKGWEKEVLKNYTEEQLIQNWANILYENNRSIDRLNNYPLTSGEMQQIIEQISFLRTPFKLNGFINGKSVTITRDNPEDKEHFGKEVSLKIYDRREIAAGQSRYQIVQQPKFPTASKILNDRRGDLMLLINGMPVFHIELKKSGIPVSQACNQIEKYAHEGIFSGLFALVQIFVAMNPEEALYFANPGPDGKFNPSYQFHWADFNNEPINDWKQVTSTLLSIPMAHQMIGFYTVADGSDDVLKVMRSYQYFAANAISDKVSKTKWEGNEQRGGYIWHTTGSGKTMTSFKSAQLIASSKDADKVIFLMDRIELGAQSLEEYRGFAAESEAVQATENTGALVSKLKSPDPANTLIVTSIQKMSNIKDEADGGLKAADLEIMNTKRIVFIVDECHRSTFGDMLLTIKQTFPRAVFFGFTGTPIHDENQKKMSTTTTVFGNELHRYSIADGIRDKNVLGFDPYKVTTFDDQDLREVVALEKAKASSVEEAMSDDRKKEVFLKYHNLPMPADNFDSSGKLTHGIEYYIPSEQYEGEEHRGAVVRDILKNWTLLSQGGKFHAIFATSSIAEAILYYRLFKEKAPQLKISAIFDQSIDNSGGATVKEDGLVEIISDYNARYGHNFSIPTFGKMKKDIAARLAHKKPYERIEKTPALQLDLLIVVDQMLTGFDSKWVNTLYMDKVLYYENIIQAFSRTNRLFGPDKPFGTIKYYRFPHTMEKNIEDAVKLYSGEKPFGLFADRLFKNIESLNYYYTQISDLFEQAGVQNFIKLPEETAQKQMFAVLFGKFNDYLEAAKVQGFSWKEKDYNYKDPATGEDRTISVLFDKTTYDILRQRYRELFTGGGGNGGGGDLPFEIVPHLTTFETEKIGVDYMNTRFDKYLKSLAGGNEESVKQAEDELHKTFATLSQEEQKFANIFLHDIQSGDVVPEAGKTLRDYITEYISRAKDDQIHRFAETFGLSEELLRGIMELRVTEANINEFGRFDALKATFDRNKTKEYFEQVEGVKIIPPKVPMKLDKILRDFVLQGGFDLEMPDTHA